MCEQLQPLEPPRGELFVGAAAPPVLVGVGAVVVGVEVGSLHRVDRAFERLTHELGIRVVPGNDGVEALVEVELRVDGVEPDTVAELAQADERTLALG